MNPSTSYEYKCCDKEACACYDAYDSAARNIINSIDSFESNRGENFNPSSCDLYDSKENEHKIDCVINNTVNHMGHAIGKLVWSDESKADSVNSIDITHHSDPYSLKNSDDSNRETVLPSPDGLLSFKYNNIPPSLPLPIDESLTDSDLSKQSQDSFTKKDRSCCRKNNNDQLSSSDEINQKSNEKKLNIPVMKSDNDNESKEEYDHYNEEGESYFEENFKDEESNQLYIGDNRRKERKTTELEEERKVEIIYNRVYSKCKTPEEMFQDYELNYKVKCEEDEKMTSKLNCLKFKGKEEYICKKCAKEKKCVSTLFEDWYPICFRIEKEEKEEKKEKEGKEKEKEEKEEKEKEGKEKKGKEIKGFVKCSKCGYFKPVFLFMKRNKKKEIECSENNKMCLFCRQRNALNNKRESGSPSKSESEPFDKRIFFPPINKNKRDLDDILSLISFPENFVKVAAKVLKEELNEYYENKEYTYKCVCGNKIAVVEGLKYRDKLYCVNCVNKAVKNKELEKNDFVDPIYECYESKEYKNLLPCLRCCSFKRIASFVYNNGKKIGKYCRACAIKKNLK